MLKETSLIIPFLIVSTFCFSQELSRNIFASQGDSALIEDWTLDWTLGESFVETVTTSDAMYTQGFQQPILTIERIDLESISKQSLDLVIYPNPVEAILHVHFRSEHNKKLHMSMYDVTGQLIQHSTTSETEDHTTVDVSNLSTGVYLLKFSNTDGSLLETHRVIKQ